MQCNKLNSIFYKAARWCILLMFYAIPFNVLYAQDSGFIKVLFLYGSKPAKQYRNVEPKWFGGMLGGHVGIEGDSNSVFNFNPHGKYHLFASKKHLHSIYSENTDAQFWNIFGGTPDSVKEAIVIIPVTKSQRQVFDSIKTAYLQNTPYDYAFLGMRCAAAAYDILAHMGIVKKYCRTKTFLKIFYPAKLRHRLFAEAEKNGWEIIRQPGSVKRKWERG